MDIYFKICAGALVICVCSLLIEKKEKDIALLLSICGCCCVGVCLISFLQPVVSFVHQLQAVSAIDEHALQTILKVVGIGILAEISCLVCQDAGKSALGKMLQTAATALILWLSLPLFSQLLELITQILREL